MSDSLTGSDSEYFSPTGEMPESGYASESEGEYSPMINGALTGVARRAVGSSQILIDLVHHGKVCVVTVRVSCAAVD
jgi:hypothetical protein